MSTETTAALLLLKVLTPEGSVLEGEVFEVTLPGSEGELGVLPAHAALLTKIIPGALTYSAPEEQGVIAVGRGVAEVRDDRVIVLVESAVPAGQIDAAALDARRQQLLAEQGSGITPERLAAIEEELVLIDAQVRIARPGTEPVAGHEKDPSAALRFALRHCGVLFVRLIPQGSRALHLDLFERPARLAYAEKRPQRQHIAVAIDAMSHTRAADGGHVVNRDGLVLNQPARGYRYSLDPFLLAGFCRPRPRERVLDLGAGVGVLGLLLAARHRSVSIIAVEVQPDLVEYAVANARASGLADRFRIIQGDLRDAPSLFRPEHFHRVVANPPYRRPGSGAVSPEAGRAQARQELSFSLSDLARTAAFLLRFGGSLEMIHLAERLPEIFRALAAEGLEPKQLRFVVPFAASAPRLCLIQATKGGRSGLLVQPQLIVHARPGRYSDEVASLLSTTQPLRAEGKKRQRDK